MQFVANHLPEDLVVNTYYGIIYEKIPRKRFNIFGDNKKPIGWIITNNDKYPGKVVLELSARATDKWLEEFKKITEEYERLLEDKNTNFEIEGEIVIVIIGQKKAE